MSMTLDEFRIAHSNIIALYQGLEFNLKRICSILSSKFTIEIYERISPFLLHSLHHLVLSLPLRHNLRSHLHSLITVNILHGFNKELSKFFTIIEVTSIPT